MVVPAVSGPSKGMILKFSRVGIASMGGGVYATTVTVGAGSWSDDATCACNVVAFGTTGLSVEAIAKKNHKIPTKAIGIHKVRHICYSLPEKARKR